ncbi:MAG: hypothetical protein HKN07_06470 [Acidimicrobiia bacterium]|nr:hypothetical protein [Acidimicrobiia bacterium]
MTSGPVLFSRFALPPNTLGYCGPEDIELLGEMITSGDASTGELRATATAFAGAWPYLELIGHSTGRDPLDTSVVEAYWIGNRLLDEIDVLMWGNATQERFRPRAGSSWSEIESAIQQGGVPNHAFHVFCAYPWVGLLKSGNLGPALQVLDSCRIRWGTVEGTVGSKLLVTSQPLRWDGTQLFLGSDRAEEVYPSVDPSVQPAAPGTIVALHWSSVCQPISIDQREQLRRNTDLHLAIVNGNTRSLAARMT